MEHAREGDVLSFDKSNALCLYFLDLEGLVPRGIIKNCLYKVFLDAKTSPQNFYIAPRIIILLEGLCEFTQ